MGDNNNEADACQRLICPGSVLYLSSAQSAIQTDLAVRSAVCHVKNFFDFFGPYLKCLYVHFLMLLNHRQSLPKKIGSSLAPEKRHSLHSRKTFSPASCPILSCHEVILYFGLSVSRLPCATVAISFSRPWSSVRHLTVQFSLVQSVSQSLQFSCVCSQFNQSYLFVHRTSHEYIKNTHKIYSM